MIITLANLHKATKQEIFDQVATHLLTQNKHAKSINDEGNFCMYRVPETNLKCAVGCLIADSEYILSCENSTWYDAIKAYILNFPHCDKHEYFLAKLQGIHDSHPTTQWTDLLYAFAVDEKLDTTCLQKFNESSTRTKLFLINVELMLNATKPQKKITKVVAGTPQYDILDYLFGKPKTSGSIIKKELNLIKSPMAYIRTHVIAERVLIETLSRHHLLYSIAPEITREMLGLEN